MKKLQTRFKSPVAITSLLVLLFNQLGLKSLLGLDDGTVTIIIDSIIAILLGVGILNNPTCKNKF